MKYLFWIGLAVTAVWLASCSNQTTAESLDKPLSVTAVTSGINPKAPLYVGDELKITGTGLNTVAQVKVNDTPADIVKRSAGEITITIPSIDIEPGTVVSCAINFYLYNGEYSGPADNVAWEGKAFMVIPPVFKSWDEKVYKAADEVIFTGEYLDVVKSMDLSGVPATIKEQSETSLTIIIPDKTSATNTVNAYFGANAEFKIVVSTALKVSVPGIPVSTSMTPQDGVWGENDIRYYIGKEVTVKGENLDRISKVSVGDFRATIKSKSLNELIFIVPTDYAFTTATEQPVVFDYPAGQTDSGDDYDAGSFKETALVYPFYYWKDITMNSSDPDKRFFSFDDGRVVSANEWLESSWDAIALSSVNVINGWQPIESSTPTTHIGAQKPNPNMIPDKATYLTVKPYLFINGAALLIPSNSISQLHGIEYYTDRASKTKAGILGDYYNTGTPMFFVRSQSDKKDLPEDVKDLSFKSILGITTKPSSGNGATKGTWGEGDVLLYMYLPFDGTTAKVTDSYKMAVFKCTATDGSNIITFDCFWPKRFR